MTKEKQVCQECGNKKARLPVKKTDGRPIEPIKAIWNGRFREYIRKN